MLIADICVFRGVNQLFSYVVPDTLTCAVGMGVQVPFGRFPVNGVIFNIRSSNSESEVKKLKSILKINETAFVLNLEYIQLIQWFSSHYQTTLHKAYQTIIGNRKYRDSLEHNQLQVTDSPYTLNEHQQSALDTIIQKQAYSKHLIHGITGSGKTEIYMRLAEYVINQNKQIIICCPEIALTPQFKEQFTERFHDHVVVVHSGLTAKQRDHCWRSLCDQKASIVIGPRSAIFSPMKQLGMVVIDEEHDGSYKQDNHPRYYTHEIAQWRCKFHNCQLVLGSATPSVSTFIHAQSHNEVEESSYSCLPTRATGSTLPDVHVVDMTQHEHQQQLISAPLLNAMETTLNQQQKVLLLLNRRGYAPYITCQSCKKIHSCSQCGLSYTYHKDKQFRCHRCDVSLPVSHVCLHCKKPHLAFTGQGIQKIQIELEQRFPQKKVIRLDKDTAKTAKQMETLLNKFKDSGDILIGTQLIAKGHHIEAISLVGVLGIDTQLNIPDFRSAERSFQLLMQVAGRAGRGKYKGNVIVQTRQPKHYAITCSQTHDYTTFIEQEANFRKQLQYPPYGELIYVIFSCTCEKELKLFCKRCETYFKKQNFDSRIKLLGPKPAPIEKIRDHFRWSMLIKHPLELTNVIKQSLLTLPKKNKDIRVITDFNPQQLL